jgi:hypothetical protein
MKTVQAFQTSDGKLFDDEEQAELHETFLESRQVIEEFLQDKANPYKSVAQRGIARNVITHWENWKNK